MSDRIADPPDERALAVAYKGSYYAYGVIGWLIIADMALHGLRPEWVTWGGFPVDLFVMSGAGGLVSLWYSWRHRALLPGQVVLGLLLVFTLPVCGALFLVDYILR
ncbi:hypothetical protein ACFL6X_07740 [Candidatus Latescibacterota bacterium]